MHISTSSCYIFQVHTTLLDADSNELGSSVRPAMLPHTSGLVKSLKLFFTWPLFVLGLKGEADTVFVSCMNFYEVCAVTQAVVIIHTQDLL